MNIKLSLLWLIYFGAPAVVSIILVNSRFSSWYIILTSLLIFFFLYTKAAQLLFFGSDKNQIIKGIKLFFSLSLAVFILMMLADNSAHCFLFFENSQNTSCFMALAPKLIFQFDQLFIRIAEGLGWIVILSGVAITYPLSFLIGMGRLFYLRSKTQS